MTHTSDPWIMDDEIYPDGDGIASIIIFGPDGPGHGRVATAYAECGRESELLPNAYLITAAPSLLEALIQLREWVRNPGEDDSPANEVVIYEAEAAIAKARGE